jgi:hypothetical protein
VASATDAPLIDVRPGRGTGLLNAPTGEFPGPDKGELLVKLWAGRLMGGCALHQLHLWGFHVHA